MLHRSKGVLEIGAFFNVVELIVACRCEPPLVAGGSRASKVAGHTNQAHIAIPNPSIFERMHGDNLAFIIFAITLGAMPIGLLLVPILGK